MAEPVTLSPLCSRLSPFHDPTLQPPLCLLVCAAGLGALVLNYLLQRGAAMGALLLILPGELAGAAVPGRPLPPERWGGGWISAQKWPWGCREDMSGRVRKASCP